MTQRFDIAMIGSGLSGALLAIRLARQGMTRIALVGPDPVGAGLAYGTSHGDHLLNVAAGRMSLFGEDPQNFTRWLAERAPEHGAGDFVPRALFGAYVAERYAEAAGDVARFTEPAVAVVPEDGGYVVELAGGGRMFARQVVLALGNFPPRWPQALACMADDPRLIGDPWDVARIAALPQNARVLLLGTGLTMIDVALTLLGSGHEVPMLAVSRHGLLPQPHLPHRKAAPVVSFAEVPHDPLALLRWLRSRSAGEVDWRPFVDALRPITQSLWRDWSPQQKGRFLRHARAYWDVHRHRLAPPVAARLAAEQAAGRLAVAAGRVTGITAEGDRLRVDFSHRGRVWSELADAVVNCTGPAADPRTGGSALLGQMLAAGLVTGDAYGLLTDGAGGVLMDGQPVPGLHAIGPLSRPALWEITAVPDIRGQVAALAARLAP